MEKKFIRFKLAKEDIDLIGWKNSLPTRSFKETINKILVSESIGQIARIPCEFSSPEMAEETDASFYVADENVLVLLGSIKRGGRTDAIKGIIRKHIQYNRENLPEVISVDLLYEILVDFRTKMAGREAACAGVENKYRKLCDTYDFGTRMIFDEILACYESEDEKLGDRLLRQLDVDQIVARAFEENFGPQCMSDEVE